MIIKGNSIRGAKKLSRYLLTENENERVGVLDIRGSLFDDLQATLASWEQEALAVTKGEKPLYSAKIRLAPGEKLNAKQWTRLLDVMERKLGFADQPRAVIAHLLNGAPHLHVIYSRLDRERGVLIKMSHDRRYLHETCRQLEKEFGLRELKSEPRRNRNGNDKTRSAEHRMAKEAGTTRTVLCNLVKAAWMASKTGRQFQQHLERVGITMTHGDRRDYNVWHKGKRYDPVRLLEEVRTAEFRAKMQIDPPRTNEQGISDGRLISRNAAELQGDTVRADLMDGTDDPSGLLTGDLARRRAAHTMTDQASNQFNNDHPPQPTTPRVLRRRYPALTPRLRPKLWYGDPGI